MEAYNSIANELSLSTINTPGEVADLSDLRENGSLSRSGLMLLNQEAREPEFDFHTLNVIEGQCFSDALAKNGAEQAKTEGLDFEFGFYSAWYGGDSPSVINNAKVASGENALILCDSYGQAFRWLIAENYSNTYVDINRKRAEGETLASRMNETSSDIVYFIFYAAKYKEMAQILIDYMS